MKIISMKIPALTALISGEKAPKDVRKITKDDFGDIVEGLGYAKLGQADTGKINENSQSELANRFDSTTEPENLGGETQEQSLPEATNIQRKTGLFTREIEGCRTSPGTDRTELHINVTHKLKEVSNNYRLNHAEGEPIETLNLAEELEIKTEVADQEPKLVGDREFDPENNKYGATQQIISVESLRGNVTDQGRRQEGAVPQKLKGGKNPSEITPKEKSASRRLEASDYVSPNFGVKNTPVFERFEKKDVGNIGLDEPAFRQPVASAAEADFSNSAEYEKVLCEPLLKNLEVSHYIKDLENKAVNADGDLEAKAAEYNRRNERQVDIHASDVPASLAEKTDNDIDKTAIVGPALIPTGLRRIKASPEGNEGRIDSIARSGSVDHKVTVESGITVGPERKNILSDPAGLRKSSMKVNDSLLEIGGESGILIKGSFEVEVREPKHSLQRLVPAEPAVKPSKPLKNFSADRAMKVERLPVPDIKNVTGEMQKLYQCTAVGPSKGEVEKNSIEVDMPKTKFQYPDVTQPSGVGQDLSSVNKALLQDQVALNVSQASDLERGVLTQHPKKKFFQNLGQQNDSYLFASSEGRTGSSDGIFVHKASRIEMDLQSRSQPVSSPKVSFGGGLLDEINLVGAEVSNGLEPGIVPKFEVNEDSYAVGPERKESEWRANTEARRFGLASKSIQKAQRQTLFDRVDSEVRDNSIVAGDSSDSGLRSIPVAGKASTNQISIFSDVSIGAKGLVSMPALTRYDEQFSLIGANRITEVEGPDVIAVNSVVTQSPKSSTSFANLDLMSDGDFGHYRPVNYMAPLNNNNVSDSASDQLDKFVREVTQISKAVTIFEGFSYEGSIKEPVAVKPTLISKLVANANLFTQQVEKVDSPEMISRELPKIDSESRPERVSLMTLPDFDDNTMIRPLRRQETARPLEGIDPTFGPGEMASGRKIDVLGGKLSPRLDLHNTFKMDRHSPPIKNTVSKPFETIPREIDTVRSHTPKSEQLGALMPEVPKVYGSEVIRDREMQVSFARQSDVIRSDDFSSKSDVRDQASDTQPVPNERPVSHSGSSFSFQTPVVTISSKEALDEPLSDEISVSHSGLSGGQPNAPTETHRPHLAPLVQARTINAVVDRLKPVKDGAMEVELHPAELGRVRLHIQTTDSVVSLVISADRPEIQDLFRRHVSALTEFYEDMGYDRVDVAFAGGQGAGSDQGDGDGSNAPANGGGMDMSSVDVNEEEMHSHVAGMVQDSGVDLRL